MTAFHDRASIGLAAPNPARLGARTAEQLNDQYGLTVHHTGADGTLYRPDPIERLRAIQAYHMDTLGYGDIAYEGAFDADGNTYGLRDNRWVGAHALGTRRGGEIPNEYTNGIVFLEDVRGLTPAGNTAFAWWCDLFAFAHGRHPTVYAHEYWSITECPGSYLINLVRWVGGLA